jgi:hypothetical protein
MGRDSVHDSDWALFEVLWWSSGQTVFWTMASTYTRDPSHFAHDLGPWQTAAPGKLCRISYAHGHKINSLTHALICSITNPYKWIAMRRMLGRNGTQCVCTVKNDVCPPFLFFLTHIYRCSTSLLPSALHASIHVLSTHLLYIPFTPSRFCLWSISCLQLSLFLARGEWPEDPVLWCGHASERFVSTNHFTPIRHHLAAQRDQ